MKKLVFVILGMVLGRLISEFVLWLVSPHFDFIATWVSNRIWMIVSVTIGAAIGGIIGWKLSNWLWDNGLRVIRSLCRWVKNIFSINSLEARIAELENKAETNDKIKPTNEMDMEPDLKKRREAVKKRLKSLDVAEEAVLRQYVIQNRNALSNGMYASSVLSLEHDGILEYLGTPEQRKKASMGYWKLTEAARDLVFEYFQNKIKEEEEAKKRSEAINNALLKIGKEAKEKKEREEREMKDKVLKDMLNRIENKNKG
jgi:hypothetical protein